MRGHLPHRPNCSTGHPYWARTQNDLGEALAALGEHEAGTVRLEEAVAVYRLALEERTRERVPLDWATTQLNLGLALEAMGQKTKNPAAFVDAARHFQNAAEVLAPAEHWLAAQAVEGAARAEAAHQAASASTLVPNGEQD